MRRKKPVFIGVFSEGELTEDRKREFRKILELGLNLALKEHRP